MLRCLKTVNVLDSKNMKKKKKSLLIIYAYFESVLTSEDNEKENCEKYYKNKY